MPRNHCQDCAFYDVNAKQLTRGFCRYNGPQTVFNPQSGQGTSFWPVVAGDFVGCKEFQATDEKNVKVIDYKSALPQIQNSK